MIGLVIAAVMVKNIWYVQTGLKNSAAKLI